MLNLCGIYEPSDQNCSEITNHDPSQLNARKQYITDYKTFQLK